MNEDIKDIKVQIQGHAQQLRRLKENMKGVKVGAASASPAVTNETKENFKKEAVNDDTDDEHEGGHAGGRLVRFDREELEKTFVTREAFEQVLPIDHETLWHYLSFRIHFSSH